MWKSTGPRRAVRADLSSCAARELAVFAAVEHASRVAASSRRQAVTDAVQRVVEDPREEAAPAGGAAAQRVMLEEWRVFSCRQERQSRADTPHCAVIPGKRIGARGKADAVFQLWAWVRDREGSVSAVTLHLPFFLERCSAPSARSMSASRDSPGRY